MSVPDVPLSVVVSTGALTVVLCGVLAYLLFQPTNNENSSPVTSTSAPDSDGALPLQVLDRTQYPGGRLRVYYATQTGTAESFAKSLEREGPEKGFLVEPVDLDDLSSLNALVPSIPEDDAHKAVFLCATYGEGEPPDNAVRFVDLLKEATGLEVLYEQQEQASRTVNIPRPELLHNLTVAVFGLGNKQYDHYNAMGRFVDHSLGLLGAKKLIPLGLGDDDEELETDFETWKEKQLWPTLSKRYVNPEDMEKQKKISAQKPLSLPDCPLAVQYHETKRPPDYALSQEAINRTGRHFFTSVQCPVTTVRELRSDPNAGSTVHIELDRAHAQSLCGTQPGSKLIEYHTADNLGVVPVNSPALVAHVAHALEYDLDQCFSVTAADHHEWHGAPFPNPTTIRECLTYYCDLQALPRRSDLKLLSQYCNDPTDKSALQRMASKEGRKEYNEKFREGYIGLADLLKLCPSLKLPLEHFLNVCPPLQARFYTISSSSLVHPDSIHLTVAVTKHERKDKSVFEGVCSSYLAGKPATVRVFNRESTFRLPKDPMTPILMIGPGTGVAPMRALLQERTYQKERGMTGPTVLYFGCKRESQDYIYRDEIQRYLDDGVLDKLYVAFSREQTEKVYVQHLLKQNASETWDLVDSGGAHIYVCGGVKMGHDVFQALQSIVAEFGNRSPTAAKDYLEKLAHDHRFIQELWA